MPNSYEVVKAVTRFQLKLENNVPVHIKIVGKIYKGKELAKAQVDDKGKKKEPPFLCEVINLDAPTADGRKERVEDLICNSVMKSNLEETYPDQKYVGKCFEVTKLDKRKGKEYNDFEIVEITLAKSVK